MMREQENSLHFEAAETFRHIVGENTYSTIAIVGDIKWQKYEKTLPKAFIKSLNRYGLVVEKLMDIDHDIGVCEKLDWVDHYMEMEEPDAQAAADASTLVTHRIDVQLMAQFLQRNYVPLPLAIHSYLEQYFPDWEKDLFQ